MVNYSDCPDYLKDFLMNLKLIKDRTDRTEEAYYIDLRCFLRYLKIKNGDNRPFGEISIADTPFEWLANLTLSDAYEYLYYLKGTRNNSTVTRARKASALRQFYNYLHKKAKLIDKNPIAELEMPKITGGLPKYLTLNQSLQLLESVGDSSAPERDYCIICLFLNCGMRLSELVGLNLNDYSKENCTLRLFGKGRKERIVYLNEACIEALENYLEIRGETDEQAIFLSRLDKRINKRRVQQIVDENLKRAGLANLGITTHKLRHTAATLMYQNGVDTLVLKDVLGHKSIATTEIYTHINNENLKAAAEANPLANVKEPAHSENSENQEDNQGEQ